MEEGSYFHAWMDSSLLAWIESVGYLRKSIVIDAVPQVDGRLENE
jgi:hypothetical protein